MLDASGRVFRAISSGGRRLSPVEASLLYSDQPHQPLHMGALCLLEGEVPFDRFEAMVGSRLAALPRYRRRPVRRPFDLALPVWEEDPEFDSRHHVHSVSLPAPGDTAALRRLVDRLMSRPLDPKHPPWEVHRISGLEGHASAIVLKVHPCMIEGISRTIVLELLSDPPEDGVGVPDAVKRSFRGARRASPAASGLSLRRPALGDVRAALSVAADPSLVLSGLRDATDAAAVVLELVRRRVDPLPFNGIPTGARRIVWCTFDLDDFLAMRGEAGCRVDDLVLAVVAGALRRYLPPSTSARVGAHARALVPSSDRGRSNDRGSAVIADLPLDTRDPEERLQWIVQRMRDLKAHGQRHALDVAFYLASVLPAVVSSRLARELSRRSLVHTLCTNVPGAKEPRYVLGRRILEIHPIAPLFGRMGIGFAALGYAGKLSICATTDPALAPHSERLRAALMESVNELRTCLGVGSNEPSANDRGPRVAELMTRDLVVAEPNETLDRAWERMHARRVRHLPVVDEDGRPIGLVTQRDLLRASQSSLSFARESDRVRVLGWTRVRDLMETHVSVVTAAESAKRAGRRMARHKIGCLLVVDEEGSLAGILTEADYLRWATARMVSSAA